MGLRLFFLLAGTLIGSASLQANSLLENPGFEAGANHGWWLFVAKDALPADCTFKTDTTHAHSGKNAALMQSASPARFALVAKRPVPVQPGQKYRFTAWVRTEPGVNPAATGPGVYVRLLLRTAAQKDPPAGHVHIALNGSTQTVLGSPNALPKLPLPETWTRIESVFTIPIQAISLNIQLTCDGVVGGVLWDDINIEPVPAETPLSPVLIARIKTAPIPTAAELFAAMDLTRPGLEAVQTAVAGGNYSKAAEDYLAFRRSSGAFLWPIKPDTEKTMDTATMSASADTIAENKFSPSGMVPAVYRQDRPYVDYGLEIDWQFNPVPTNDPAYTLEYQFYINRMPFWATLSKAYEITGDERYAQAWVRQLDSWAGAYPRPLEVRPGDTLVWRTLEAGIRMMGSWPDAYTRFLPSPSLTPEAHLQYLGAVVEHGRRLAEGFQDVKRSGNWVVTEACGLATLACLFPELRESSAWRETAFARLNHELAFQVWPDGAQIELSPHYHNVVRDHFAFALRLARSNGLTMPYGFEDKLRKMYRYSLALMDPTGFTPMFNDGLPANQIPGLREAESLWPDDPMFRFAVAPGNAGGDKPSDSNLLPYAGFAVMRSGWTNDDMTLWFRAGPPGFAHWHEDKLSMQIALGGQPLLTEAGHFNYTGSAMRRYVLTTSAHSTGSVDGLEQRRGVAGGNSTPVLANMNWGTTTLFDYASGEYADGYVRAIPVDRLYFPLDYEDSRLKEVSHSRHVIYLRPAVIVVVDFFTGTGDHRYNLFWHLDAPRADLASDTQAVVSRRTDSKGLTLAPFEPRSLDVSIIQGRMDPAPLGWIARERRPIPVVVQSITGQAPQVVANVLLPWNGTEPAVVVALNDAGPGWWSGQVTRDKDTWRIWLRTPDSNAALPASALATLPAHRSDDELFILKTGESASSALAGVWSSSAGARLWRETKKGSWEAL